MENIHLSIREILVLRSEGLRLEAASPDRVIAPIRESEPLGFQTGKVSISSSFTLKRMSWAENVCLGSQEQTISA